MFKRLFLLFSPKRTFAKMVESFLFISFSSVARLRAFPWAQRYHFYLRIPSAWHRVWQRTELNKCLQKVENSNSNNISLIKSFDPLEIIFSLVGTECSDHILPWIIVICECFFFLFISPSHSLMPCPSHMIAGTASYSSLKPQQCLAYVFHHLLKI